MPLQKIDIHLRNRKVLVIAEVATETELRHYELFEPIHDALRREANKDVGIGINSGRFRIKFKFCREPIHIREYSLVINWGAFPLWWSDHPKWYEGPSCHTLDMWPDLEPTISCI